ncbi:hypothetical protein M3Y96_00517900 [Aphelenchoides besseyi]|nr:hypothetical protein M3Y96_00517900 [Aphelenchoides besseyi]
MKIINPPTGTKSAPKKEFEGKISITRVEPLDLEDLEEEYEKHDIKWDPSFNSFTLGPIVDDRYVYYTWKLCLYPLVVRDLRFTDVACPFHLNDGELNYYVPIDLTNGIALIDEEIKKVKLNVERREIEVGTESVKCEAVSNIQVLNKEFIFVHQSTTFSIYDFKAQLKAKVEMPDATAISAAVYINTQIYVAYICTQDFDFPRVFTWTKSWNMFDYDEFIDVNVFDLIVQNPLNGYSLEWKDDKLFYALTRRTPKESADVFELSMKNKKWSKLTLPPELEDPGESFRLVNSAHLTFRAKKDNSTFFYTTADEQKIDDENLETRLQELTMCAFCNDSCDPVDDENASFFFKKIL